MIAGRLILAGMLTASSAAAAAGLHKAALDQYLETSHESLESPHFTLRFPKDFSGDFALRVSEALEAELRRLRAWIPIELEGRVMEVLLFDAEDFERVYGPAVIGIYDGRIRVPVVASEHHRSILRSTLTHELVHALVTEHAGWAPSWVHEGLAQYLELNHRPPVPTPITLSASEPLSLTFMDEVLLGSEDPDLVDRAYRESVWAVHYLGSRYGISGIRRLLAAFAAGHDTDTALLEALQVSKADFERELWSWCVRDAPRVLAAGSAAEGPEELDASALEEEIRVELAWRRREMREWYGYYEPRVRPTRKSLRHVVEAMRGEGSEPLEESCRRLFDDLAALRSDSRILECPHLDVRHTLSEAFRHLRRLALSCKSGRTGQMRNELGAAEESLGVTAYLLRPYGLSP